MNIKIELAKAALESHAVELRFENPVTWSSGIKAPVYFDTWHIALHPVLQRIATNGFAEIIGYGNLQFDRIGCVPASGIPFATLLMDRFNCPVVYYNPNGKDEYGRKGRLDGEIKKGDRVLVIENIISTAKSSGEQIYYLRKAGAVITDCLAVFCYGLSKSAKVFNGEIPFDEKGIKLDPPVKADSILDRKILEDVALENGFWKESDVKRLEDFFQNLNS